MWRMTTIRPLAATLLAAAGLALAACGGGEDPAATAADRRQQMREAQLAFARCMREHGVDMPDPSADERGLTRIGPRKGQSESEFREAEQACRKHLEAVDPPELSDEQREEFRKAALEHARCMRENGVPKFPDPTFGEGGGAQVRIGPGTGIDPDDPDFREAQEKCRELMEAPRRAITGEDSP
jgi:hypothetical protein